jgi:hypothetical protein
MNNEDGSPVGNDPNQHAPSPVEPEEPEIQRVFHPHSKNSNPSKNSAKTSHWPANVIWMSYGS